MTSEPTDLEPFWERAATHARLTAMPGYFGPTPLQSVPPPTWSFGSTPEVADELLGLVLAGTKSATSSDARWYDEETPAPRPGGLSVIVDSTGRPRALVVTTEVAVVAFDQVSDEHARLEGEGDRSLAHWREVHERVFTEHAPAGHAFSPDMPVLTERFEVLHQE